MRDQVGGSTKRDFAAQSAMITEMYSKSTAHITYQASNLALERKSDYDESSILCVRLPYCIILPL